MDALAARRIHIAGSAEVFPVDQDAYAATSDSIIHGIMLRAT